ncbi:MAG: hypothetical protein IPK16_15090 [Anaerolineales bacterium]|nr:hypothetical protein [Anaerolineales bacterium]
MDAGYILGDPKNLVKFLLDKYGAFVAERNSDEVGMPYLVYEVPEQTGMRGRNLCAAR